MEGGLPGGDGDSVAAMHVKTEAADDNTSALALGSREPPAPCGETAGRRGGGGGGVDQTAEELQAASTTPPVLLYPVGTDHFFPSGEGKTYLKIAPASAMPPASSEKTLPTASDFSSKAVLCLIEAVGRRWGLYETRERSQLFQSVQEEMASRGHMLPVEKIRRKWNNLIVTYKRVKDRSRETGHAKTSWEFFDLMDATLCDTVGTQVTSNKRSKGGNAVAALAGPLAKVVVNPQVPQLPASIRPNGDFASTSVAESAAQAAVSSQIISSTAAMSAMAPLTVSPNAPELKALIVLNSDNVTSSVHPATIAPSPSFISPPCFTETASSSPSFGSTSNPDLNTSRYAARKTSSFSPGVIPFHLSNAPPGGNHNPLGLASCFSTTSSCLPSAISTTSTSTAVSGAEGQGQKRGEQQTSATLFQRFLKQQEEQAYLDRVTRRQLEAREKRRERREVRMAESLGRIATALELLSSKQDTVIALLQRLADRK